MKKQLAMMALVLSVALPAHAINSHYRQQLERSGCTQVTEAQGCDIHKTKAQNQRAGHGPTSLGAVTSLAESFIGLPINQVAEYLVGDGWKANNGDWFKKGHQIRLVVEHDQVVNAQVLK